MLGPLSLMSLSRSFQTIPPILLPWLMPLHSSLCYIIHALVHSLGEFLVSMCCILVLGKNIFRLCFMPLALICRMHPSKWVESFRFFCIMLPRLDVLRCDLEIYLFVFLFQLSALSETPSESLVPPTL